MFVCVCVCACVRVCVRVCVYVYAYVYTQVHVHVQHLPATSGLAKRCNKLEGPEITEGKQGCEQNTSLMAMLFIFHPIRSLLNALQTRQKH